MKFMTQGTMRNLPRYLLDDRVNRRDRYDRARDTKADQEKKWTMEFGSAVHGALGQATSQEHLTQLLDPIYAEYKGKMTPEAFAFAESMVNKFGANKRQEEQDKRTATEHGWKTDDRNKRLLQETEDKVDMSLLSQIQNPPTGYGDSNIFDAPPVDKQTLLGSMTPRGQVGYQQGLLASQDQKLKNDKIQSEINLNDAKTAAGGFRKTGTGTEGGTKSISLKDSNTLHESILKETFGANGFSIDEYGGIADKEGNQIDSATKDHLTKKAEHLTSITAQVMKGKKLNQFAAKRIAKQLIKTENKESAQYAQQQIESMPDEEQDAAIERLYLGDPDVYAIVKKNMTPAKVEDVKQVKEKSVITQMGLSEIQRLAPVEQKLAETKYTSMLGNLAKRPPTKTKLTNYFPGKIEKALGDAGIGEDVKNRKLIASRLKEKFPDATEDQIITMIKQSRSKGL